MLNSTKLKTGEQARRNFCVFMRSLLAVFKATVVYCSPEKFAQLVISYEYSISETKEI